VAREIGGRVGSIDDRLHESAGAVRPCILLNAIQVGNEEALVVLERVSTSEVNTRDEFGGTPFHLAASQGLFWHVRP